ncbi:MAG: ABC transporter substrate-binding protein [Gammaproteobacteria bacterium]|nr:ABC transporter substrate-binding protein [Gammaproteobacteria bacterium]MDH3464357.1 ABC transporter substrate-binding protein [Gammaproteobacteria bacterium]
MTVVAEGSPALRLGWQIPWATQGQLVMGLKHTNIPQLVDLEVEYIGFAYGGPLNRAALAGEVDVLLTADQPALVLLSKDPTYRIVARMMYNRVCIYVPVGSGVNALTELANKTIMGPVGAAAERVAMSAIATAGIDLSGIRTGKLDMSQQSALLANIKDNSTWPGVDALYGFDPLPAVFEEQGKAKILHCGKVVSVVIATAEMLSKRREKLKSFLSAFRLSWHIFANNPGFLNQYFSTESRLHVSDAVLDDAASVEPNRWVHSIQELRFDFIPEDFEIFDQASRFLVERNIIKSPIDARAYTDLGIMKEIISEADQSGILENIEIRN